MLLNYLSELSDLRRSQGRRMLSLLFYCFPFSPCFVGQGHIERFSALSGRFWNGSTSGF